MVVRRERLPRTARTWGHLAVAAFFLNALPFSLFAYSELTIPSTLAGICNATSPLWGMALSLVALSEDRPTRRRVAGLGLGFLGVLTVLGAWQGFSGLDFSGTAMALLASLSYPIGWIYVRRTLAGSGSSTLALTGSQLFLGTVQIALVTPLFTSAPDGFPLLPTLAVVALGALGTGLAVLLQYGLVAGGRPDDRADGHVLHSGHRHRGRGRRARRAAELEHPGRRADRAGRSRPHPEPGPHAQAHTTPLSAVP